MNMPLNNKTLSQAQHRDTRPSGDPPTSTLAAQIVDNLSQGRINPNHEDRENLRKLLQEILSTDDESEEAIEMIESRVEINQRLIYVIVKFGLECLTNDDPFNDPNGLKKQAIESLSVVELTLRRSPEVLFSVTQGYGKDLPLNGPLHLWLIPRLFQFLIRIEDRDICQRTLQVLQTTLGVERKPSLLQGRFQVILRYTQGCIKGKPDKQSVDYKSFDLIILLRFIHIC